MSGGRADSGRACGWSVLALGLALIAIPVVRWLAAIAEGRPPTATAPEFVLIGGPATVTTTVGWQLLRDGARPDHCRRVARWTAIAVLSLGLLAGVLIVYPAARRPSHGSAGERGKLSVS